MLKQFPSHHSYLTGLFSLVNTVLNRDELEIRKLFPNKDIRVINEIKKGSKEKLMEIRLDKATLSCAFRQGKLCEESYIFLDSPTELYDYIDFCTSEFPYKDLVDIWNLMDCDLQINEMDKEFIFTLRPSGNKVCN